MRSASAARTSTARTAPARTTAGVKTGRGDAAAEVTAVLAWLERRGSAANRAGMARYAIVAPKVFGVSVATIRQLGRQLGPRHDLVGALWASGWYEARMLVAFVADPARVTAAQMDRWCRDFDNWAICDTLAFALFDRTPHAWTRVDQWARRRAEFERRAAFALLASLAVHAKDAPDAPFLERLPLVAAAAADGRNFVRKAVSWALRSIGNRSPVLHQAAVAMARRLAESGAAPERWVGKDALRDLQRPLVAKRVAANAARAEARAARAAAKATTGRRRRR
jgi:3-methyladenine DNA glycosylase AlkD